MLINDNIKIIKRDEKEFPRQLYDLKDCPKQLYTMGNIELLKEFSIAVVGARNCEEDSAMYARKISYGLAKSGIVIVSGLARGIDSIAHESCLKAKGKTIAVLGGGFNDIYPKENTKLFHKIIENGGLVITEYPPDMPSMGHNFVRRNRIVAALSKGVVLIEAKENSGSISTAKKTLELKRNLFILPGAASNFRFAGSNRLLTNGGKCVLSYEDVLKEYNRFSKFKIDDIIEIEEEKNKEEVVSESIIPEEYREIYKILSNETKTANQISLELQIPMAQLNSMLTLMEMDGYVKQLPGKKFVKKCLFTASSIKI